VPPQYTSNILREQHIQEKEQHSMKESKVEDEGLDTHHPLSKAPRWNIFKSVEGNYKP